MSPAAPEPQLHAPEVRRETLRGRLTVFRTPQLPQNSVRAIHQDRRGYLWFGTEEGVVRFDGYEWTPYRIADGLVFGFVQAIGEDRDGCLWVGTRMGLSRFDPIHVRTDPWRSFTSSDGLPHDDVLAICAGGEGELWIATRGGVSRLAPGSTRMTTVADLPDACALLADSAGRIWAASAGEGVGWIDPPTGSWTRACLPAARATSLAEDRSGAIWIGTEGDGVMRLDPSSGEVRTITRQDGLQDDRVLSLFCDAANDLWIGTESAGISRARLHRAPGVPRWSVLSPEAGFGEFMNFSILQDRHGVYWFGALTGLASFVPEENDRVKNWTSFTRADGLVHDLVVAVAQESSGRYWFGTYGRGAASLEMRGGERTWQAVGAESGLRGGVVRAISEDRLGRLWFGTFGGGLTRFDTSTREMRSFGVADGLAGDAVRVISPAPDGRFWVGTDGGGISIFDPAEEVPHFANFTTADGLSSDRISSILHDSHGRVWVGTYEAGVVILAEGGWSRITTSDGLPANAVYCIAEDPSGRFWFGTGGSGLASFADGVWRVFTSNDGLPNDTIYQILVESAQSIYASTNRGVFRLRLVGDGEVIVAFDRTDGLADDECNGGASLRDAQGRFWFGTLGGASYIEPRDVPERIAPCLAYITGFEVHDRPMDLEGEAPIEDSQFDFAFRYGAVEFVSPQKIRYRTRLVGFDREWSRVTAARHLRYTNLRPGRYRLEVQARNWGGEWSRPAGLDFEVIPDRERIAREEAIERERIERRVLESAHAKLQNLATQLHDANEKLREKEMLLELQAREDALTRLPNRRYLDHQLGQEFERAVRFSRPLSIVMSDLDYFKSVNDRFGHAVGDEVLRIVARVMKTSVRSIDTVARYGGEEIVLILPETPLAAAAGVCEKIRVAIETYPWRDVHPELRVTASFGCTDDTTASSATEMLHAADQKLFEAKRTGRNRVCW